MKVDECFGPTVQGEGALAGVVTMFVRLGGCDYRCSWCDTLHAVDASNAPNWREMSAVEVHAELIRIAPKLRHRSWVTISGGNPAIWQVELPELVEELKAGGFRVNIETQGSVVNKAFKRADMVTFSPKGPSSGMVLDRAKLKACVALANGRSVLKFVVGSDHDFEFAREIAAAHAPLAIYVQPLTLTAPDGAKSFWDYRGLCERVAETPELSHWRVIPQLHVIAWGGERGR